MYKLDEALINARRLLNAGMYLQAIKEYGKVIEWLFKELYREYLPQLSYSDKEKNINFEKSLKKSVDKFTIGEWIGLFREARLFNIIKNRKKRKMRFVFFSHAIIDVINELRNRCTHPAGDLKGYDEKRITSFVESAVLCMLQELEMTTKIEVTHPPITEGRPSRLREQFARISKEDILKATRDPRIEKFRWITRYVEIEGKKYPVKGLVCVASGVPTSRFTSDTAQRILERLGFKVVSTTT